MNQKITIIILLSLFLTACKENCKIVTEKYDNGKANVIEYYPDCNDKTTFKVETYYENGQISSEGFIINNIENGKFKSWTEEGVLTAEWEMIDGKENGFIQCWHDNGIKKREIILNKGIRNGIYKEWDEKGNLLVEGNYKNGLKEDEWKYWEENGTKKIRTFKNDTLNGYTYEYIVDSSEIVHILGQYEKGIETGIWSWFDQDSILFETATFTDGEYTGEFINYYKDGTVKFKGHLKNAQYDGKFIYYDDNGQIIKTEIYKDGDILN